MMHKKRDMLTALEMKKTTTTTTTTTTTMR